MQSLLKEFINSVLLERSFDDRAFQFAKNLTADVIETIENAKLKPFNYASRTGKLSGFVAPLGSLGIIVPPLFKSLQVGVANYADASLNDSTRAIYLADPNGPGKILIIPPKLRLDRDANKQASIAFKDYKKYLFHEFLHFFEIYVLNDKFRRAAFNKQLEKTYAMSQSGDVNKADNEYYSSHHERNAYFHQAFYELMQKLDIDHKTKQEAQQLIPNAHVLWDELIEHTPQEWDLYFGDDKLRKLFAARAWDLWEKQIETLSDE